MKYWVECTFDNVGLMQTSSPILFESEDKEDFLEKVEKMKKWIERKRPGTKCISFEHRLVFTLATPKRYRSDSAQTIAIVLMRSEVQDDLKGEIPLDQKLPPFEIGSKGEQQIAGLIEPLVVDMLNQGVEARAIPCLFANAAFLVLINNGTVRVSPYMKMHEEYNV